MNSLYSLRSISFAFIVASLFFFGRAAAQTADAHIEYHFPPSGATYVPASSSIILRPSQPLDLQTLRSGLEVVGSVSGAHEGRLTLSDDGRTVVFVPLDSFHSSELVTVALKSSITSHDGIPLSPLLFSFSVSPTVEQAIEEPQPAQTPFVSTSEDPLHPDQIQSSLPADFPGIQVTANNNPAPGDLFLTTFNFYGETDGNYRMILDSLANPVYYAKPAKFLDWDFKILPDGRLAFCEGEYIGQSSVITPGCKYYAMDSNFTVVDSFDAYSATTPYITDFHDMELLQHGHALLLGMAQLPNWDMSKDVPGGKTNATLLGAVIVELDSLKNPVWIWRSWDSGHYSDTDATNDPGNLLEDTIDAVHANAVQVDTDGNILLSARSMDQITKIDRFDSAGSLIWRLGGKHNQFTFINDSIHFSHQHAVRRIANGDLTLFDNGNFGHQIKLVREEIDSSISPPDTLIDTIDTKYSRACEYHLDPSLHTATLAWHYDHDSTIQSMAMGYVDRLPNGNTLINWGFNFSAGTGLSDQPAVTEVTPDGTIAYELHIQIPLLVYRAVKLTWNRATSSVTTAEATESVLKLGNPFPNPSNGTSQVVLSAPASIPVSLELYDATGRVVRHYFQGIMPASLSALSISTAGLSSGAYELRLEANGSGVNRQLIVIQ